MAWIAEFSLICCLLVSLGASETPHRRFEYKYSFKGPHLVQKDGNVPFWEHGGHAIPADESVRITPSLKSKKGSMWCKNQASFEGWEIEIVLRVTGRGRIGADGMAIWYTTEKNVEGPVFGSKDQWNGLGIFLDSFDNDGLHNNPYILAIANDGTKQYEHQTDGLHQQLGGCLKDFRNRPFPVRVKVTYYNNALEVLVNDGLNNNKDYFEMCLRYEGLTLPKEGYFGVTAATGGLADDQDVMTFLTHSLSKPRSQDQADKITEQERETWQKEYDQYQDNLQKAQDEYRKEHPETIDEQIEDPDKWFETQQQHDLRMVFDGQSRIQRELSELQSRVSEVLGKQESTLARLSMQQQQQGGGQQPPQVQGGGGDGISRHDVNTMMANQRDLLTISRELKMLVERVNTGGGGGGAAMGQGMQMHEMNDHIRVIRSGVEHIKETGGRACPPVTGGSACVSPFMFFLIMGLHFALTMTYFIWKASKDAAAKKFY